MFKYTVVLCVGVNFFIGDVYTACVVRDNGKKLSCLKVQLENIDTPQNEQIQAANIRECDNQQLGSELKKFTKLQHLRLQCQLQVLDENSFSELNSLLELNLNANSISFLPNNVFTSLKKLLKLELSNNRLQHLELDTFHGLNALTYLDLSNNKIDNIPSGVFDWMKHLKTIDLKHNQITLLPIGLLDETLELQTLDVSYNLIREILPGTFEKSTKLTKLNLEGNKLESIPQAIFSPLSDLKELNLAQNKLTQLSQNVFEGLEKLTKLNLKGNKLKTVELFKNMERLTELNLADCNIVAIAENAFVRNEQLESVDLSQNRLTSIPEWIFNTTKNLKYFNISRNYIRNLPTGLFQQTDLMKIDLSHNLLEQIQPDLLNMENLEQIHAQYNRISYLEVLTFASCAYPIKFVDLRCNKLVFIEESFFEWIGNIEWFEIGGNPWDCKCLNEMLDLLNSRFVQYTYKHYFDGERAACIPGNLNTCNYEVLSKNLTSYYDLYKTALKKC